MPDRPPYLDRLDNPYFADEQSELEWLNAKIYKLQQELNGKGILFDDPSLSESDKERFSVLPTFIARQEELSLKLSGIVLPNEYIH